MDLLTAYIFNNYQKLLTPDERAAHKAIIGAAKVEAVEGPKAKEIMRKFWGSDDPKVKALMADGMEAFMERTSARIMSEHSSEVFLNYCSRCGTLAKTPRAKQCAKCFLSWHDEE